MRGVFFGPGVVERLRGLGQTHAGGPKTEDDGFAFGELRELDRRAIAPLRGEIGHGLAGLELAVNLAELRRGIFRGLFRGGSAGEFVGGGFGKLLLTLGGDGRVHFDPELGQCALGADVALAVTDDGRGNLAVTADHKLRGDAHDPVKFRRRAIVKSRGAALVRVPGENHIGILRLIRGDPFLEFRDRVARAGSEHDDVLVFVLRRDPLRMWKRLEARPAPSGPEVEDDNLALVIGEADFFARDVVHHEIRCDRAGGERR